MNSSDRQKFVSFTKDEPLVVEIPTVHDYTDEEVDRIWYSYDDQDEIMEDAIDAAKGVFDCDSGRGLEKLTQEGSEELDRQRETVVRAVLQEQSRLRESATDSDHMEDLLARTSCELTMDCQDKAYRRGYDDELAGVPRRTKPMRGISPRPSSRSVMGKLTKMIFRA